MPAELLLQLLGPVGAAVGVYAAIRADLAAMRMLAQLAHESAAEAHRRIDGMQA